MQFKSDEEIKSFLHKDGFLPDGKNYDVYVKTLSSLRRISVSLCGLRDKDKKEIRKKLLILIKSGCG